MFGDFFRLYERWDFKVLGVTEKSALARVLLISRKAYFIMKDGKNLGNAIALLDNISAILSRAFDEKQPARKSLGALKRLIKAKNKPLYPYVHAYFNRLFAAPDYDIDRAKKHIPAIIHANDLICAKLVTGEVDKVKSMCSAMVSYPGYIFGEYAALSDKQFYELVFGYYKKFYEDEFMEKMKYLFE